MIDTTAKVVSSIVKRATPYYMELTINHHPSHLLNKVVVEYKQNCTYFRYFKTKSDSYTFFISRGAPQVQEKMQHDTLNLKYFLETIEKFGT